MDNCVKLYNIICSAEKIGVHKGWVYLLYYPILKELDSMKRHLRDNPRNPYSMRLVDRFYYGFGLYDSRLPAISMKEFQQLLKSVSTFIPSPLKQYVPLAQKTITENSIINYHDASPCFYSKGRAFRVVVDSVKCSVDQHERSQIIDFIVDEVITNELIDNQYKDLFKTIVRDYVNLGADKFPIMSSWLEPLINSSINYVVTDQTLAPAQCCVNHMLKAKGKYLIVLQHQRNLMLTDIFPLVYLDFSLSDIYCTWFSSEFIEKNHKEYLPYIKNNIIQTRDIIIPQINKNDLLGHIEMSSTCLLILNATEEKYIEGTMSCPLKYADSIRKTLNMLYFFHYKVYVRKDPRSNTTIENIIFDDSNTLKDAIHKYDFCVCDRPGGAAIEVLEEIGFVFVCFDRSDFKETLTYTKLREKGNQLKMMKSKDTGILSSNIDLLLL